ncbi:MAG: hypothetical protein R3C59_22400 [Planctomycetaceae bacterium]
MRTMPQTSGTGLLLCLLTLTSVNAAEVSVKASASAVRVSEPFTLELTVSAPAGTRILFPSVTDQLGEFDVIDHTDRMDVPTADDVDVRTWNRRLTLESIVTGDLQIPAMELQAVANGTTEVLTTDAVPVQVLSVLEGKADPTQFRDIQSVVDVNVPKPKSKSWLWWTLGGSAMSLLALAGMLLIARRRTWMTPADWAARELEQLRSSPAVQSGDSETICRNVTGVLRDYLELQYDIPAPVQTTTELLHIIQNSSDVTPEAVNGYAELFATADQARFAGLQLTGDELTRLIDEAQRLLEDANASRGTSHDR